MIAVAGCGNDLPSASFIEKLRVLMVQAEPPEVAPGQATALDILAVEPPVQMLDGGPPSPLTFLWLACTIPPGTVEQVPCGVGNGALDTIPPWCADQPGSSLCVIGTDQHGSYTPPASVLSAAGTGQILLTVAVADTPEGATGCLMDTASNTGLPTNPDHCVLSLKRLTVSDPKRTLSNGMPAPPPNQNPKLIDLYYTDEVVNTSLVGDMGTFAPAPVTNAQSVRLVATRDADSAEMEAQLDSDGNFTGFAYEALTVAWFTTAGKIDGGRSAFTPPACPTQAMCPTQAPGAQVDTHWTPPTDAQLPGQITNGSIEFWAVIRDDRGGVSAKQGIATKR